MVLVDAVARMVPGVLSNGISGETESFEGDLLEYPQYSRPEVWHGKAVPSVLLSGNQKEIASWRTEQAKRRTRERRPDLYRRYEALEICISYLQKNKLLHMDMIELICRGQARLIYQSGANICLCDRVSGGYLHTAENEQEGSKALLALRQDAKEQGETDLLLMLHQQTFCEEAKTLLGVEERASYYQVAYTRKEKLPITGLYSLNGKKQGVSDSVHAAVGFIRALTVEELPIVAAVYRTVDDEDYLRERIERGWMFGAYIDGALAGFVGMHAEGGLGLLEVLPQYRRRQIGRALETYLINLSLERGMTPYAQVAEENEASIRLQKSLGLSFSKQKVYWMEKQHPEKL